MSCNHSPKYAKELCKKCYDKGWYVLNKDKEKARCAAYYKKHKKQRLKDGKKWRKYNSKNLKKYYQNRLKDPQYRLTQALRSRLYRAIKNNQKSGSAIRDLGCSIEDFKLYLESKFIINSHTHEYMSWDNYGKRWEIDHIRELFTFDLTDRQQFLIACHYTNLQPLWKEDHLIKTAKFNAIKSSV